MRRVSLLALALAGLLVAAAPASTGAQEPETAGAESMDPSPTAASTASESDASAASAALPQRAPQARTLRAHWHVFVAFAVTWVLLFGYVLSLGRRFGRLERDLQRLGSTAAE